jgi:hypothetical protein
MDVNAQGQVAVANTGAKSLALFAPATIGNTSPTATISGAGTGLSGPAFVAFTPPPAAQTGTATAISANHATLHGAVTPDGSMTDWYFQYRGQGTQTWENTPRTALPGEGATPTSVQAALNFLTPNTTYQYRLIATNPGGRTTGGTESFTTR